jgi:hypothetical protein
MQIVASRARRGDDTRRVMLDGGLRGPGHIYRTVRASGSGDIFIWSSCGS